MADRLTVYRLASEFDKEYPREPAETLATRAIESLTDTDRKDILAGLLASEIDSIRRDRAREVERRAWAEAHPENPRNDPQWVLDKRERSRDAYHERKRRRIELEAADRDRAELFAKDPEEYRRQYTIGGIIEAFEEKVRTKERLRVTAELLTVVFATGDGRKVTWGAATLEDHRKRIELLARGIKGNVQTIRLHEYAVQILRDTGAECLNKSGSIAFA